MTYQNVKRFVIYAGVRNAFPKLKNADKIVSLRVGLLLLFKILSQMWINDWHVEVLGLVKSVTDAQVDSEPRMYQ